MKLKRNQIGFSAVELVIIAVIVTALAVVGYMVYSRQQDSKTTDTSQTEQSATANDVSSAPEINDGEDLDDATRVLDQNDPSASDADAQMLDNEVSNF
jgi:Tfp pilus assembly protein PilV